MKKVIFDTNALANKGSKDFLGGRTDLVKFSKVATIIIPDIVLGEIKNQKERHLTREKVNFLKNPLHKMIGLDSEATQNFDINKYIESLGDNENLIYETIDLTDFSVLEKMKELALKKQPPFEEQENTDKGFKDAYLYFTVLEYQQTVDDRYIFVCTKDNRLKEAFQRQPNIIVVKDYDEFLGHSIEKYKENYFIEQLIENLGIKDITTNSISDYWFNIDDNRVLLVNVKGDKFVVEVDAGEIISSAKVTSYADSIDSLINSGSFQTTHSQIETLNTYISFLSDDEIIKILQASLENSQIRMVLIDDDVKQFISTLYEKKKAILPDEVKDKLARILEGSLV